MRDSRQLAVIRSLFRTLHPTLTSGLKNGLAPAKRMFTGAYQSNANETPDASESSQSTRDSQVDSQDSDRGQPKRSTLPPLPRSLTDEHLIAELETATAQFELQRGDQKDRATNSRKPPKSAQGRRHFSRDSLLSLLEEAKVRIQVLETELELARGTEQHIPLLTEEWSDDLPSTRSRRPD